MRICALSDTHGYLPDSLPEADVLIHAGDTTARGTFEQHKEFINWFSLQPHSHKLYCAGNHDLFLESMYKDCSEGIIHASSGTATYLRDSGTTIDGVKFWGTPWTPMFNNWAFMYNTANEAHHFYSMIPEDTDVLICHGPAYGILDLCPNHEKKGTLKHAGSKELLYHINRVKPKIVIHGHIHASYGTLERDGILYVNAAHCTENYKPLNFPIVIEV